MPDENAMALPKEYFGSRSSVRPCGVMIPTMNSMPTTTAMMHMMPLMLIFSFRKIAARIVE